MNTKMSNKMLLILQFWKGDRKAALKLAKFLADLEPKHCELADFLLVSRFDCENSAETVSYLSRKFNVWAYQTRRQGTGWPHGCNELWFGSMEWFFFMMEAGKIPHYKCAFTFEADGAPVLKNWIQHMSDAWDRVSQNGKVKVAGALVPGHMTGGHDHINGNALFSGDFEFLNWLVRKVNGVPATIGWDYILAHEFKRLGWADIPGMRSYYNTPTFSDGQYQQMMNENLIWVHGDKSGCLIDRGYKTLLNR